MTYKGAWNATSNTPTIASGVGAVDDFYLVSVGGSAPIDGVNSWLPRDEIHFNGTIWEKVRPPAYVTAVFGAPGAVPPASPSNEVTGLRAAVAAGVALVSDPRVTHLIQTLFLTGAGDRCTWDMRGSTLLFDLANTSQGPLFDVPNLQNAILRINAGRTVNRFHACSGNLKEVSYVADDQQPYGGNNNAAHLISYAPDLVWEGLRFSKIDMPVIIIHDRVKIRRFYADSYRKGIRVDNVVVDIDDAEFGLMSSNSGNYNGDNAIAAGPSLSGARSGTIRNVLIRGSGEHAIYLANLLGEQLFIENVTILSSGQSGIKLRHYKNGAVRNCISYDCSSYSTTGSSEDNFRLEQVVNYDVENLTGERRIKGNCGNAGLWLGGVNGVRGHSLQFSYPRDAGVVITDEIEGGTQTSRNVFLDGIDVIGGVGANIVALSKPVGQIELRNLNVRECPGHPLLFNIPAGHAVERLNPEDEESPTTQRYILIEGTFSPNPYSSALLTWIPPNDPLINLSKFLPANLSAQIAGSATVPVGLLAAETITITGGGTITSLGAGATGWRRTLFASSAFTLTSNSGITGMPATQTIAAGERVEVVCIGGSVWAVRAIVGVNNAPRQPVLTKTQLLALSAATYAFDTMVLSDGDSNRTLAISDGSTWRYVGGTAVT
jgi:hypothetical protein